MEAEESIEIEYELSEDDLLDLARSRAERSPAVRRRLNVQRAGYLIGFLLLGVGSFLAFASLALLVVFGSLGIIFFLGYPFVYRRMLERGIRRAVARAVAVPFTRSKRSLRATPDGLEQITEGAQTKLAWKLVDGIEVTATRAVLSISGGNSPLLIPKQQVGEEQFNAFVEFVRQRMEMEKADA